MCTKDKYRWEGETLGRKESEGRSESKAVGSRKGEVVTKREDETGYKKNIEVERCYKNGYSR